MNTPSLTLLGKGTHMQHMRSFTVSKERRTLEENFLVLISKFEKDPSKKLATEITEASTVLLDEYKDTFNSIASIVKCYSKNIEQYLWKNVFYCVIEIFRKAMNSDSSAKYNVILVKFIDQALNFYSELINQYEALILPQKFADVLYWPEGSSLFCVNTAFIFTHERSFTGDRKILLRSVQRHYLALGDLFRYKSTLVDSTTNVKLARRYYFKGAQANLHNGRAFNLLGVLASLSRNFLDMNFYYVLALSAKYPFNSARESLGIVCNQVQQIPVMCNNAEQTKVKNVGTKRRTMQKHNASYEEVWIRPNKDDGRLIAKKMMSPSSVIVLDDKAQRLILFKWLHLAGILLTNIGMEKFQTLREQALHDFYELIKMPESILTTASLLKITLIFVFASHHIKSGASESSANLQRNHAIRVLLDIMATIVGVTLDALNKLETQLCNKNSMLNRVLPTLGALSRWLISPSKATAELLSTSDYFLDGTLLSDFALFFNKIKSLQNEGRFERFGQCVEGSDKILLPEYIIMSSFYDIFPSSIPKFSFSSSKNSDSIEAVTIDCRLYTIMTETEAAFMKNKWTLPHLLQLVANIDGDRLLRLSNMPTIIPIKSREKYERNGIMDKKSVVLNVEDDELLKKNLIGDKSIALIRKVVLEICPKYLVPDTNTFIDHLELIQRIVDSKLYTVLVPTIVVTELSSLSTDVAGRRASGIVPQKLIALLSPELGPKSKARNVQMQYVMRQAGATIEYLKHASQMRTPHLTTITTNGNVLSHISFAQEILGSDCPMQTNDDRILASCIELCNNSNDDSYNRGQSDAENDNESITLKRNTVFLTEDRALCIKAVAARVPTRSAPQFIKWSGI